MKKNNGGSHLTKNNMPTDHSHSVSFLWSALQVLNFFWSLGMAEAFAGNGSLANGAIDPLWPVVFLLNYLFFRTINYGICHLLGYHAEAKVDEIKVYNREDFTTRSLFLPTIIRSTTAYRRKYQARAKMMQLIFETGFILLIPFMTGAVIWLTNWVPGGDNTIRLLCQFLLVLTAGYFGAKGYYWLFPRVFNLNTLFIEHGQPIFAHKRVGIDLPLKDSKATKSSYYTTEPIVKKQRK